MFLFLCLWGFFFLAVFLCSGFFAHAKSSKIDQLLAKQNAKAQGPIIKANGIDDLTFLRRATVDVIGRIPTHEEVKQFQKWSTNERRAKLLNKLLTDPRYADRWTVFFSDILRIRSNATGGNAFLACTHPPPKCCTGCLRNLC